MQVTYLYGMRPPTIYLKKILIMQEQEYNNQEPQWGDPVNEALLEIWNKVEFATKPKPKNIEYR